MIYLWNKIYTYKKSKGRLQDLVQNCYHKQGGKQKAKKYKNIKQKLKEQVWNKYRKLPNEEKDRKREYWKNRYR